LQDPFKTTPPFQQDVFDNILNEPTKVKIGIFNESEFLPVSDSVKRAMRMTREALESQGYEIVEFDLTEEEIKMGAKLAIGILSNGMPHGQFREMYENGEIMQFNVL
jgi:Asp-tRNA(Asn)/Glu-tRNA(Gln) amidotransferase A subunit family amidase